jgi:hypothetical protein
VNYWAGTNIVKSSGNSFDWKNGTPSFAIEMNKFLSHKTTETNPETGKLEKALAFKKSIVIPPAGEKRIATKRRI